MIDFSQNEERRLNSKTYIYNTTTKELTMATDKSQKALSQKQKVLKHLKQHRTITSWEAITHYGITRLASRISDLRNDGVAIVAKMVYDKQRNERWAEYKLINKRSK